MEIEEEGELVYEQQGNLNKKEYDSSNRFIINEKQSKNKQNVRKKPLISVSDIKKTLKLDCHENIIKSYLVRQKYSYSNIQQIPFQPQGYDEKKLIFCRNNINRDWRKVLFVDEALIWCGSVKKKCRQKEVIKLWNLNIKAPQKVQLVQQNLLQGINKTKLYIFEGTLIGQKYKEIVSTKLFPSLKTLYRNEDIILLQDKDSKHQSNVVQERLFRLQRVFEIWLFFTNLLELNPQKMMGYNEIIYQLTRYQKQ